MNFIKLPSGAFVNLDAVSTAWVSADKQVTLHFYDKAQPYNLKDSVELLRILTLASTHEIRLVAQNEPIDPAFLNLGTLAQPEDSPFLPSSKG